MNARRTPAPLPGPLGLPAYVRLAQTWRSIAPLEPRLQLLVTQLAAERSGCAYCIAHGRHLGRKLGVASEAIEAVAGYAGDGRYSEAERAALALADAVTRFAESEGGFPIEILVQARRHYDELQIVRLVAAASVEHFFDPATGRLGRDSLPVSD